MLPALKGGAAEIGGAGQHPNAAGSGQEIELLVAWPAAQQTKPQRALRHPVEKSRPIAAQQPRQRLDQRLVIDQRVGEAIGCDGLARLGKRQMLL